MLEKLLKGNIYTDLIWLFFGIAGVINFYLKGSYLETGVFALHAILYILKIFKPVINKNKT